MASHEQEDTMPEETQGYKLSQPKQSLAEYQKMEMADGMLNIHLMAHLTKKQQEKKAPSCNRNSIELPPAPLSTPSGSRPQSFKVMDERHLHRARALSRPVPPNPPNSPRLQENMLSQDPNLIRDFYMSPLVVRAAHGLAVLEPLDMEQYEMGDEQPTNNATDENDESLQRYKESLGLGGGKDLSDASDPRVCIILSLTMESPGRDPVTIDLAAPGSEATLKDKPFKIKEGCKFTMVAKFKVQHEILSGLQYVQVVKRKGIKVSKDSEMLGSYAPNTDKQTTYTKRFQEEDAPSGMLARGHYNAISSFVDDDKKTHLTFEWSFDIAKDW
ncbi:rho GDP dissociation inhibitor [Colletotrichum sp. CLE4]